MVRVREHRISSKNSYPYICVEGPDANRGFAREEDRRISSTVRSLEL